jgi:ATP-dependent Lon protease
MGELSYDASKIFFVTSSNNKSTINEILSDRQNFITLDSYTADDKFLIAKQHLLPRIKSNTENFDLLISNITDDALKLIVKNNMSNSSMRQINTDLNTIVEHISTICADLELTNLFTEEKKSAKETKYIETRCIASKDSNTSLINSIIGDQVFKISSFPCTVDTSIIEQYYKYTSNTKDKSYELSYFC